MKGTDQSGGECWILERRRRAYCVVNFRRECGFASSLKATRFEYDEKMNAAWLFRSDDGIENGRKINEIILVGLDVKGWERGGI